MAFAVRSGHGDGSFAVHEQGEDAHRDAIMRLPAACCDDSDCPAFDGAGVDHGPAWATFSALRRPNSTVMPSFKSVGFGFMCADRSVHRDSFGVQHFGQNAHTGTADTDEMVALRSAGRAAASNEAYVGDQALWADLETIQNSFRSSSTLYYDRISCCGTELVRYRARNDITNTTWMVRLIAERAGP